MSRPFAAVILAGGRGSRLGGVDKAALRVGQESLLARALSAVVDADDVVVVGPQQPGTSARFVREDPPFAGPAAALLTGVAALRGAYPTVVVVAVDMPWVSRATVDRLVADASGRDGAVLVDESGRHHLALALNPTRLAAVTPSPQEWPALAVRRLTSGLDLAQTVAVAGETQDVDTPEDLAAMNRDETP